MTSVNKPTNLRFKIARLRVKDWGTRSGEDVS